MERLKGAPVNFVVSFAASHTFPLGKFLQDISYFCNSSPKEPSACLVSKRRDSVHTPYFVMFSIKYVSVICTGTTVHGIVYIDSNDFIGTGIL